MQKSDQHVHKPLTTGSCFGPYFWGPLSEDPEPWSGDMRYSKMQNIPSQTPNILIFKNKIFKNLYYIRRPSLSDIHAALCDLLCHKGTIYKEDRLKSLHVTLRNALLQHRAQYLISTTPCHICNTGLNIQKQNIQKSLPMLLWTEIQESKKAKIHAQ